ncbi:transferase family-domain-containing protein [Geopyxis carbonaria]|nr:transferase family-domain-containing protein [Geopyxis carbonaria]
MTEPNITEPDMTEPDMTEPDATSSSDDFNDSLDIFGQLPFMQICTQITLLFPLPPTSTCCTRRQLVSTLNTGLSRLASSFPWVASSVLHTGGGPGDTGVFSLSRPGPAPSVVVKTLADTGAAAAAGVHDMATLRAQNFPMRLLPESALSPRPTLPRGPPPPGAAPPVLTLQATFGQLMHLLSKACRGDPFTPDELAAGNLDRRGLIPLLENYDDNAAPGASLARMLIPPAVQGMFLFPEMPAATWANFTFPAAALAALKARAAATTAGVPYVSSDDAVTALLWQAITRARLPRLATAPAAAAASTLMRAVNVRRHLNVPPLYPGLLHHVIYHTLPLSQLATEPVGAVASRLRAALEPEMAETLAHDARALATFLSRTKDKGQVSFVAQMVPGVDVCVSSWAKLDAYKLDFGMGLGTPEAVRRPRFEPAEGLVYLLPRKEDGGMAVAVCLRDTDLEGLRKDVELAEFATYDG